jgi:large subunit ribosomal protein L23
MATAKKATEKVEKEVEAKPVKKASKTTKPAAKKVAKKETAPKAEVVKAEVVKEKKGKAIGKANIHDFDVIVKPLITEKSMALIQNQNKVTVIVKQNANKDEIKIAFEKVFGVHVTKVHILNVLPKEKSRGGRYKGSISGFKKALVTIAEGEALDLFKE